jgi:hypothetical protein
MAGETLIFTLYQNCPAQDSLDMTSLSPSHPTQAEVKKDIKAKRTKG